MHVVEEWHGDSGVGCILALEGNGREALLEISHTTRPADFSGLSLQFRTEDLAGFIAALPAGTQVRGPTMRPWGSTYLYLSDPNGISIVVFEGEL